MSINCSYYPSLLPKQITHFTFALGFTLQLICLFCLVEHEGQGEGDEIQTLQHCDSITCTIRRPQVPSTLVPSQGGDLNQV